jgi:hypothetical protein
MSEKFPLLSAEPMTHVWRGRRNLPERYGEPCRILVARKGKFVLEFADGLTVSTVRGTFRRMQEQADG